MMALVQKERVLAWITHPKKDNKWELEAVALRCVATGSMLSAFAGTSEGGVLVFYEFEGFKTFVQREEEEDLSEF